MPAKRKLTDQQGRSIAARFLAGVARHDLAVEFEVSERTISSTLRKHGVGVEDRVSVARAGAPAAPPDPAAAAEFAELGPPPTDPMKAVAWMHRALAISAWQAIRQPTIEEGEGGRRRELREIAKAMATCTPQTAIHNATEMIHKDADELEKPGGPEMVSATAVNRRPHRGAPRRGRPRKL